MENYVDFEEKFRKLIENHKDDRNYELIKDYPKIFSIVLKIASDKNSDGCIKMIMNTAISYFVLPTDVISEKTFGIKGYIDDFFICICALRKLIEYDKEFGGFLIKKYWTIEEDYESYLINKDYAINQLVDQKIISDVLSSSGMNFVTETICLKNNSRKYFELKTHDLQRKIHYLIFLYLNNRTVIGKEERKKFEEQIFGTEEFMDFTKKLELLSKKDKSFANGKIQVDEMFNLDEKLKKVKTKRLLR